MKDTTQCDHIISSLKKEETFDEAKTKLLVLLRSQCDYFSDKKSRIWRLNKTLTALIIVLLFGAALMAIIGYPVYMLMIWIVCAGLWYTKEINVPMKKYLAYSTISLEALTLLNECQALETKEKVNLIKRQELMKAYQSAAASWRETYNFSDTQ